MNDQMNILLDRQNTLDNLTAIETTAKLLINALIIKPDDNELCFNEIQREELIIQTATFLTEARQLILNISNNLNVSKDGFFEKTNGTSPVHDISQNGEDNGVNGKTSPSKKTCPLSSITLEDIIQKRLTPKDLFPNYPLLHDSNQPNLVSFIRHLRQIDNLEDAIFKVYSKIFNHDERICCNYNGINSKLPYPRHKRLLFDLILKLILNERQKPFDENERDNFYTQCEQHFSTDTPLLKYPGVNIDNLNENNNCTDEKQFLCLLFRLVIPQENIKEIVSAKQDLSSQWNDNDICIYYAHPVHLLWIKQKWLEHFPIDNNIESEKWSQCIDWAIESFLEKKKIRPSKRKTVDISMDHKRSKPSLTLQEKLKQIDRTKFNVYEYAMELIQHISDENNQSLPTFEQLQMLESNVIRFYWTPDQEITWSQILDSIRNAFLMESNDDFRQLYSKKLVENNPDNQIEIERLLQIT
ncbi:hypothetical protein I4U23_002745 [Adineta vaga]|nr:hypothetical protein I4U23_002745 [Adineta vaga]